jgi:MHS family proline/betaine transporter-like MFS transporter
VLAATIVIMSLSTFAIGLIPSYASIGIWAPILLLLAKMAQGFSVGRYTGASIFVAEYAPTASAASRQLAGLRLDCRFCARCRSGGADLHDLGEEFLEWGWRLPFFLALPLGIIGLYLRHALEETPAFQQHVDKLEAGRP